MVAEDPERGEVFDDLIQERKGKSALAAVPTTFVLESHEDSLIMNDARPLDFGERGQMLQC